MTEPAIPGFLERRPLVFSYTFLNTYKNTCPFKAAQQYVYRTTKYVETPEMKFGNDVHSAFEHRIGGGKPLPEPMQQWEPFAVPFDGRGAKTEMKLGLAKTGQPVQFFGDGVWLRGKLDTTLMNGTKAYLVDWKTGGSKYEDPFELEVGALLLHAANPQLTTIIGNYAWLKENRLGQQHDLSNTRKTWNTVNAITVDIERDKAAGSFEKRQGPLCKWCEVFTCENNTNPKNPVG